MTLATWIETAAKGRLGGPVRAGMWSAAVIGTHPVQDNQRVSLELAADESLLGTLPAYWIENKGGNSFWHAPIPPQAVGVRLHYRAIVERARRRARPERLPRHDRPPNLPDRTESTDSLLARSRGAGRQPLDDGPGRRPRLDLRRLFSRRSACIRMFGPEKATCPRAAAISARSSAASRSAAGSTGSPERAAWEPYQQYQGATNLLTTKLTWRHGPIQVLITDFVAMGDCLPLNAGREKSPGQYIKRFLIRNEGTEARTAIFAVYVQAEVNGGVGDIGLSWHDIDRSLLAINRGHGHANRKLARDATIEFALALDGNGEVECEPTGPNEAILFRPIELPAGGSVTVDLLVSGAFTGWSGDRGTFEHWLRPALNWFRSTDLDLVEHTTAKEWDDFIEPIPDLHFPKPTYAVI